MAIIAPPNITALPTPPSTSNPATFDTLADGFIAALPNYRIELNNLANNVYNNAISIASDVGSTSVWVSGSTYTVGTVRFSPLDNKNYRCKIATSSSDTTDPSLDTTKWALVVPSLPGSIITIQQLYGVF